MQTRMDYIIKCLKKNIKFLWDFNGPGDDVFRFMRNKMLRKLQKTASEWLRLVLSHL